MKIFVISLETAADRRKAAAEQLGNCGHEFEIFDAVERVADAFRHFSGFDRRLYLLNTRREPLPGEIGCYASHLALWKICVALDEPIVIMEDDFQLLANFAAAIRETENLIKTFGFIRLQSCERQRRPYQAKVRPGAYKLLNTNGFELHYLSDTPLCMLAYAINPKSASALIESSATLTAPVDKFLQKTWEHQTPIYALSPSSVVPSFRSVVSTIGDRSNKSREIGLLLRRLVHKGVGEIRRSSFDRKQLVRLGIND